MAAALAQQALALAPAYPRNDPPNERNQCRKK